MWPTLSTSTFGPAGILLPWGFGRATQKGLELRQGLSEQRRMAASLNREVQRTVEDGDFIGPKPFRLPLAEPHSGNALAIYDLIVERSCIPVDAQHPWQRLKTFSSTGVDERRGIQRDREMEKPIPAVDRLKLGPYALPQRVGREIGQGPTGATPQLIQ